MDVKSTVTLSRDEAIEKAVQLYVEIYSRKITAQFYAMDNDILERKLMLMSAVTLVAKVCVKSTMPKTDGAAQKDC